jgi:predicted enzyme related to lactoylglutathione lyase
MDSVITTKIGDSRMITGSSKAAVEAAVSQLSASGARILSKVEPLGSRWMATCEDPDDRRKTCQIVKLGMQLMVKGPTQKAVSVKVQELARAGARLISAPSEATGGGWVAVFDDIERQGQAYTL